MAENGRPSAHARARGHSGAEVDLRLIAKTGIALGAVLGAILAGVFALHARHVGGAADRFGPTVSGEAVGRFPEPRLQIRPAEERARYLAEQGAKAAGYAWVDRERGIVRIPVERAMRLLAQEAAGARNAAGGPP
jgi:hypothetical protein